MKAVLISGLLLLSVVACDKRSEEPFPPDRLPKPETSPVSPKPPAVGPVNPGAATNPTQSPLNRSDRRSEGPAASTQGNLIIPSADSTGPTAEEANRYGCASRGKAGTLKRSLRNGELRYGDYHCRYV